MSCVQAIARVTEFLRQQIDGKMIEQTCFLDLKKVFDTLDHELLLEKLENYGLRGRIEKLMRILLNDRQQHDSMNAFDTERLSIKSGVPQGSVLGPFIFLTFINYLPDVSDKVEKNNVC